MIIHFFISNNKSNDFIGLKSKIKIDKSFKLVFQKICNKLYISFGLEELELYFRFLSQNKISQHNLFQMK